MSASHTPSQDGVTRRDFLVVSASAMAAVGGAVAAWPLINSLNPAADTLAMASTEVNLDGIAPGQGIKIMWRGKPVFVRRRTAKEIADAKAVPMGELRDPQADSDRVKEGKEEWLVMVGVCTHLGCIPIADKGDYNGWFCPCHGSHYDISGRIRKGPAPTNLAIPPYAFLSDTVIRIG
jgi:ubiquinol-cytochrome c reductase iron-sulfur subunit